MNKGNFMKGLIASASTMVLLVGCGLGTPSTDKVQSHVGKFDGIEEGSLVIEYGLDSKQYGKYDQKIEGDFSIQEGLEDEEEDVEEDKDVSFGKVTKVKADEVSTIEEDIADLDEEEYEEYINTLDIEELSQEEMESLIAKDEELYGNESIEEISEGGIVNEDSLKYDYKFVEKSTITADGRESSSVSEVVALGDYLYDKVYLTGSEADGKFVYDERGVALDEYPISDFLLIEPIIEALDIESDEVELRKGKLANGENGVIFTLSAEYVEKAIAEAEEYTELSGNVLSLASESEVNELEFGINDNSFSVVGKSTSTEDKEEQTSEVAEEDVEAEEEDREVGYMYITKKKGSVEIEEPVSKMDIDEFQSIIDRYYEDVSGELEGEEFDEEDAGEEFDELNEEELEEVVEEDELEEVEEDTEE